MIINCVWEHNGNDTLLYAVEPIGAYARGESLDLAMEKIKNEIVSYMAWSGAESPSEADLTVRIVQESNCSLHVADADSDVLFEAERAPLSRTEYETLKRLALKSAEDFEAMYASVQNPNESCMPKRKTFYGDVPRTAQEMYDHTRSVNAYYFGEIGVEADNEGRIADCRRRGFERLEQTDGFLENPVMEGSYGELWSLRKVLRRFLWHDRIHAKAMYRMAIRTFGKNGAENPFGFLT